MRQINSLKENECIHIRTKKEAKGIAKLAKYLVNTVHNSNGYEDVMEAYGRYNLRTVVFTNNDKFISYGDLHRDVDAKVIAASDFLPLKNDKLRKKVLKAFPELINLIDVKTELTELPEKWCVNLNETTLDYVNKHGVIKPYSLPKAYHTLKAHFPPIYNGQVTTSESICSGYTEISTEDFKRLVLKEEVKKELEVGKWYKGNECLFFLEGDSEYDHGYKTVRGYGIIEGDWIGKDSEKEVYNGWSADSASWTPATDKEVETALINESKKRGFKDGVNISSAFPIWSKTNTLHEEKPNDFRFKKNENELLCCGVLIFKDGIWAEIIEHPKSIDWNKAGQLVCDNLGQVWEVIESVDDDCFKGLCRMLNYKKHFKLISRIDKINLKLYTGKPITLSNDNN